MKQHIYGLTGFASVGKDTVADLLVTHLGFRKLAFADALRGEVAAAFAIDLSRLTDPHTKNEPMDAFALSNAPAAFCNAVLAAAVWAGDIPDSAARSAFYDAPRSPRQIMQWWGTEYRRAQNPQYWTDQLLKRVQCYRKYREQRFVITDCRFGNEVDVVVRHLRGELWQITRPGIDAASTAEGQHISATSGDLFKPSLVIANNHDIRHLQQLVLSEFFARESGIATAKVTVAA